MSALPIPPGVPFGKYVIRTRLGQGGMGEVFLADQLGPLGPVRPVALKRLLPKHTHDPHVVRMFLEEMGVAAQLSHPHIVVTYDFGELDGAYFLAMEYVDGLALDRLVAEQGPLPLDAVVTLGRHIASALQHAHERVSAGAPTPVVHQDVTPHNILVSRAGDAKLLDFGIARTEAAALGERVHAKVRYAAPEQLRRAPPDRRFDVWGLGVTLYQALTGRLPFPQADLPSRVRAQEGGHFVPLEEFAPDAAAVADVVHRALAARPQDRFQTAAELGEALAAAHPVPEARGRAALGAAVAETTSAPASLDGGEVTATGVAVERRATTTASVDVTPTRVWSAAPKPGPRRRSAWWAVAAGLLLGGLGVLAAWTLQVPIEAPATVVPLRTEAAVGQGPRAPAPAADHAAPGTAAGAAGASASAGGAPASAGAAAGASASEGGPAGSGGAAAAGGATTGAGTGGAAPAGAPAAEGATAPPGRPVAASATPPATRARTEARSRPPRTAARPRPAPATPAPAPVEPTKQAESGLGLISVRTVPWARVSVDGRPLGEGVIAQRPLPSGPHVLRLVPGSGDAAPKEVPVTITPGGTTRVFVDFDRDEVRVTH